jgi:two-component system, OmpR family, sensor kinase
LKLQLFLLKHHFEGVAAQLPKGHALMRALQSSDRQLERITRLIDDLLDVSRLTRGQLVLNLEETSLEEIVRDVAERCHNELDLSKCHLKFESSDSIRGRWDKLRIEQVVENLLTNAMKYGPGKPIEVIVSRRDDWARLEVHDFGIGIAKEDQERIFQRFERAVPITAYGGLGLGLFITRQIVAAHHGTVHIESELGRGATFIVELPSIPLPAKVEETEGKPEMTDGHGGK